MQRLQREMSTITKLPDVKEQVATLYFNPIAGTSEEFAELLRDQQDRGTQNLFFGVGPADGFSDTARAKADLVLSFGKMTLAHELARVVLLEQIYRGFTILKGHPYHTGH